MKSFIPRPPSTGPATAVLEGRIVDAVLQARLASADNDRGAGGANSTARGPSTHGPPAASDMSPLRTFIVEDSPIILDNLVATLEEMAPVQVVGNAPDETAATAAIERLAEDLDLVIIDVFLKSGSGMGVLRHAHRAGLGVKRVVLTNYATPDMREKCRALGADRVFDKSNDLDELLAYCTRLAEGHGDDPAGALN